MVFEDGFGMFMPKHFVRLSKSVDDENMFGFEFFFFSKIIRGEGTNMGDTVVIGLGGI